MPDQPVIIALLACDLARSPLGTPSRLLDPLAGTPVLRRTIDRLLQVPALAKIVLAVPADQSRSLQDLGLEDRADRLARIPLTPRPDALSARIRSARAWNLDGWRGGAGQYTVFDEDYHPKTVHAAASAHGAAHVLCVPAAACFVDPALVTALITQHLDHNHEMRLTFTPAAPGFCGILLHADLVAELTEATAVPGQLLAYDPRQPTLDNLGRDACLQVDPAVAKLPNRLIADTARAWQVMEALAAQAPSAKAPGSAGGSNVEPTFLPTHPPAEPGAFRSAHDLALAARDVRASLNRLPRELELELTADRLTTPPGALPAQRTGLPAAIWTNWLAAQKFPDDLLLTIAGDGDPLLYPDLLAVLRAARAAGPLSIALQTDLLDNTDLLRQAIDERLIDVISPMFYAMDDATYEHLTGTPNGATRATRNLEALLPHIAGRGTPLVVPRLLKTRATIPQLEAFFDTWTLRCGWAVIDYPTDRAGAVPYAAVVDMAPPKRRPCRRIADRLFIRADGIANACTEDTRAELAFGRIPDLSLDAIWQSQAACTLRARHAAGEWGKLSPCATCREWHRA